MKRTLNLSCVLLFVALGLSAQTLDEGRVNGRTCGPVPTREWDEWFNTKVKEYKQQIASGKSAVANYVIPVVVHVIHAGQDVGIYPNLSENQIQSQITVLNNDYAGVGTSVNNVPQAFAGLVANTNISFCLAKLDTNGNCLSEPGIDRIDWHTVNGATNPAQASNLSTLVNLMDNVIKPATIWNPTRYLNIWVSDAAIAAFVIGYATFPGGSGLTGIPPGYAGTATTDGIWVLGKAFGSVGTLDTPYNLGRTATHEIGHWLGLRHIWGDNGQCGASDFCNDTPPQKGGTASPAGSNFGCPTYPLYPNTCTLSSQSNPNGDMFMNFMDYGDDACTYMFTPDQATRMQTAMANGTYRSQLTAHAATLCSIPAAAPIALFSLSTTTACVDSVINSQNQSTGGPCPTFNWSINPGSGFSFLPGQSYLTAKPKIKFSIPGTYTITVVATNTVGSSSLSDIVTIYDCNNEVGLAAGKMSDNAVVISPNPSNGLVNLDVYVDPLTILDVIVYNSIGEKVIEQRFKQVINNNLQLDMSVYPNGIYSLVVSSNNGKVVKRLVLNK